jgi:hypothetical protein
MTPSALSKNSRRPNSFERAAVSANRRRCVEKSPRFGNSIPPASLKFLLLNRVGGPYPLVGKQTNSVVAVRLMWNNLVFPAPDVVPRRVPHKR